MCALLIVFSLPEHTVGNVVRKVLHNIREEYNTAAKSAAPARNGFSISKFVLQGQPRKHIIAAKSESMLSLREDDPDDPDSFAKGLKPVLMEAIQDVLDELETVYDNVSKTAKDHIHSECVRVSIRSRTLVLKSALVRLSSQSGILRQWKLSSSLQAITGIIQSLLQRRALRTLSMGLVR